jgi:hypothetical protein
VARNCEVKECKEFAVIWAFGRYMCKPHYELAYHHKGAMSWKKDQGRNRG